MFLVFLCLAVLTVKVENKHKIYEKSPNATEGMEIVLKSWYPMDAEFNESCVSEGCPALNNFSLCPNEINITVLHSVLNTAVGCMRRSICGILIDRRLVPSLAMTTDEWLPGMGIDGTVTTLSESGFLTNVSSIQFRFLPNHNQTHQLPLHITMFITEMRAFGNFKFELSLRTMLPSILGQPLSVTITQAKYDMDLQYLSTILVNRSLTGDNYLIKLFNPIIKTKPSICGLDMPDGFPTILTLFTSMSHTITEKSSWAVRKAALLEKYFQSAIRAVSNSC